MFINASSHIYNTIVRNSNVETEMRRVTRNMGMRIRLIPDNLNNEFAIRVTYSGNNKDG